MPVLRRRRVTDHLEVDTEGSWAISYGDMITLLLTFFILFFSTDKQKDRMEAMQSAMVTIFDGKAQTGVQAVPQSGADKSVEEKIEAKVHKVGNKLIVEFPDVSFYEFGKVDLNAKGKIELKKFIARYMPYAGNYILGIRAYTDNKKVLKGKNRRYSDNLELSALRSISAMRYMQQLGIMAN
jgi:flagellar motor protein MotB